MYETDGKVALQELTRSKPLLANRTPPETEALVVKLALEQVAQAKILSTVRAGVG